MSESFQSINTILKNNLIQPEIYVHAPVLTCEEADRYTPEPEYGLKSLLLKSKKQGIFCAVLEWNARLDMNAIKTLFDDKRISFVSNEEAPWIAWCEPWSIPPFWHIWLIPVLVSRIIKEFPSVYFNPWKNTYTYKLSQHDFERVIVSIGWKWF